MNVFVWSAVAAFALIIVLTIVLFVIEHYETSD